MGGGGVQMPSVIFWSEITSVDSYNKVGTIFYIIEYFIIVTLQHFAHLSSYLYLLLCIETYPTLVLNLQSGIGVVQQLMSCMYGAITLSWL